MSTAQGTVDFYGGLRLLVGCPGAGKYCRWIGVLTPKARAIRKSWYFRYVSPIDAGCLTIDPRTYSLMGFSVPVKLVE